MHTTFIHASTDEHDCAQSTVVSPWKIQVWVDCRGSALARRGGIQMPCAEAMGSLTGHELRLKQQCDCCTFKLSKQVCLFHKQQSLLCLFHKQQSLLCLFHKQQSDNHTFKLSEQVQRLCAYLPPLYKHLHHWLETSADTDRNNLFKTAFCF